VGTPPVETGLGTARIGHAGVAWFRPRRPAAPGVYTAVVVTGRAAGRISGLALQA
jgi:hypothetical protein